MTVGERIKKIRTEKCIAQIDLADKCGISKQTLYKYENNIVTNIPLDVITKLARALNVTESYLMGWNEPPQPGTSMEHIELIGMYEKLTDEQKIAIKNMMASMIK